MLRAAGLRIDGFVAPAWSMPPWLLPLLGERGYRFTEDHLRVYDPATRRARPSVVLNWATRSPGRLLSTVAWCRVAKHARARRAGSHRHPPGRHALPARPRARSSACSSGRAGDFVARGAELLA